MFLNFKAFKSRQILELFIRIEIKYIYRSNFVFQNKRTLTSNKKSNFEARQKSNFEANRNFALNEIRENERN